MNIDPAISKFCSSNFSSTLMDTLKIVCQSKPTIYAYPYPSIETETNTYFKIDGIIAQVFDKNFIPVRIATFADAGEIYGSETDSSLQSVTIDRDTVYESFAELSQVQFNFNELYEIECFFSKDFTKEYFIIFKIYCTGYCINDEFPVQMQLNNNIPLGESGSNGLIGTSQDSHNYRKIDDDMNIDEFKKLAAERLECETVRTDQVVIDFEANNENKTIRLNELDDNVMTTAYIKRCNAFITTEGAPSIRVIDDLRGQNKTIYETIAEDLRPCFIGMFASRLEISGELKGQVIVYTAERMN